MHKIYLLVITLLTGFTLQAQISGTVSEYNGNGTRQNALPTFEPGVGGIIVNAYDASNTLLTTTTSASDGTYSMPYTVPVRVEFVIPVSGTCVNSTLDYTSFGHDGNNIRAVTASTSTLNYGINHPNDYLNNTNPDVFVPQMISGNPLGGGTAGSNTGFRGHPYNLASPAAGTVITSTKNLAVSAIGSTWGVAYSKQAQKIFTSAFLKRHVGLGTLGSGGIYMLTPTATSFTVSNFYNMNAAANAGAYRTEAYNPAVAYGSGTSYSITGGGTIISYLGAVDAASGAPEGLGVIGANAGASGRGLAAGINIDSYDPAAFGQVGKVGLGDLEISDDGLFLFVMNLYDRKVYRLELDDAYNPTTVVAVTSYALPAIAVTNGVLRPFALKFHRNKIYVGAVASGENGGTLVVGGATDVYSYVFQLDDPKGSPSFVASPLITVPLNYLKGYTLNGNAAGTSGDIKKWYPWTSNTSTLILVAFGEYALPQPMLSNIEFSDAGDMIMDFMDRTGHQWGYDNYLNLSTTTTNCKADVGGDMLIAGRDCGTGNYTLENNGSYVSNGITRTSISGVGNAEGPGGGEFFSRDIATDHFHHETSMGAAAILPGSRGGIFTMMDPIGSYAGGTVHYSTQNGDSSYKANMYSGTTNGTFSKANGLGDIEYAGVEPPIEIGNMVWNDLDEDGIQDPNEVGIQNVTVELFCDFDNNGIADGAAIGTTTTDAEGHWYFNDANVTDGDCATAGNQDGPQLNKTYLVKIGSGDWNSGTAEGAGDLVGLMLTVANTPVTGIADASDNDASLVSSVPTISVTTGTKWGQNDHKNDFGFHLAPVCTVTASAVAGNQTICLGEDPVAFTETTAATGSGTLSYQWQSSITGCAGTFTDIPSAISNIYNPPAITVTTNYHVVVTNTDGVNTCTATSNCLSVIVNSLPSADAGATQNLNCTTPSAVIGTAGVGGNTYAWLPAAGLSATNIAQPTANPTATTTYTVTVTGSNSCTASDVVTVNVNNTAPTANAGATQNLDCTTTSAMIGTSAIAGNSYSWLPTTALSASNIAQPTANPSSTTIYTVTVTGTNGCTATSTVTVNVNTVAPTANAGSTQNLDCTTTSAMIGTSAIAGNSYSWLPTTALSASNIAQPTANPSSTTIYTVTVTGTNGCTATSTVIVNVNTVAPTANAGSTQNLTCTTTSAMIGTSAIAGNSYSWLPTTALSASNIAQPTANPSSTTIYTVTVTGTNGCTATSTVIVNVNTVAPTANAGATQNLDCTTTSAMIGTSAIAGNSYSWLPTTALSASNIAQPTANPSSTTIYTVTVTGTNGCTATSTVIVNVNTATPVANAGATQNLNCITTSSTIGTVSIAGNSYSWSPAAGLSATNIAQPTASPSITTIYTVTVTGANGCIATSVVTVNVNTTTPTANAGATQNLTCTITSATIGSAAIAGNSYSWLPTTALSASNIAQPTANPSSTTIYTVTVTGSNGCTATSTVTVNVNAGIPIADAGATQNLNCTTTSAMIGTLALAGNTYSWLPSTGLSAVNIAQPMANPSATTTYTVTVTATSGCTATSTVLVNVNTTAPTANAGPLQNLGCQPTSATIGTVATAGNSYAWLPVTGLSAANIAQPVASPAATTTYTLTVTSANGCTATSTVMVKVETTPPTANAGASQTLDCNTISATIGTAADPGNTYSWSPAIGLNNPNTAQPTAGPTSTTIYTVTVTGTNGCTATSTVSVNVNTTAPAANAGATQSLNCGTTSAMIGSAAIAGNFYSWLPATGLSATNIAQPIASPVVTTTYTVTVIGANGCTATSSVTVNVNTITPTANAGSTQNLNCGTTSAMIGTSAIAGCTYSWLPNTNLSADNIAQPIANPSATTTYTVTVTGANGCTATASVTVNVNTVAPIADAGSTQNLTCTVTSAMIGSSATAGNTYSWSPNTNLSADNIAQPIANPSATTTYTVTVTGANGCTATSTVTVNVNGAFPIADAGSTQNLDCTTTSAMIGTSALAGNTYSWSPSLGLSADNIAQPMASPSATTIYTVTVTGSNGCSAQATVTVNVNTTLPIADAGSTQNLDCTTTSAMIGSSAIAGNTYSWLPSTNLSATNIAQPMANPSATTTYTVTVTGANGCTETSSVTVNVNTVAPIADAGSTQNLTCTVTSAMIGSSAIAGNTYSWLPNTNLSADNIAQPIANPSATTTYTITVTGANGCTATSTVTVNVNGAFPIADAGATQNLDCTTTSAMIGTSALAGNTYSWSPSLGLSADNIAQPMANPSATTVYTVTVTGSNGCSAQAMVTVNVNTTLPIADAGSTQNLDCTTTSAMIGTSAIAGNTYSWSPSTNLSATNIAQPVANPSATTTYTVTVTGANGCTATASVTVNVNTVAPIADAGSTQNLTCTVTSAMIGSSAIAGNTYSWLPNTNLSADNIAQPIANPSATTTYTVTVTGANGCTATSTVTVNVNGAFPIADAGATQNLDCTTTSAMIGTSALAGNTYSWSPSLGLSADNIAQPMANPSATTVYTVTVTGSNGCSAQAMVTVNVNTTLPIADAGSTQNLDCTTTSAMIGTSAIAGNSYSWLPNTNLSATNIAQPIANPSATTTYTVTVTGANGCTATASVTVNVNTVAPIADAGSTQNLTCTVTSAMIGSSAIAGNTYSWLPNTNLSADNIAQPIANPSATTTYTVTVTGSNGCTATSTVTVNVNGAFPIADAGATQNLDCTTTSAMIGTSALAGNTYSWSPSLGLSADNIAQPMASPSVTTIYTVTVTGSNGCSAQATVTVNVNTTLPIADAGSTQNLDCTTTSAMIGTSAIAGNSYSWLPNTNLSATNIAQPMANPSATTTYTVTVTGANGCTETAAVTVNVNTVAPIADAGSTQNLTCTVTSAMIGTSAIAGNTYSWLPNTNLSADNIAQPMANPSATITYTVTVTGSNGCTATSTVTVNVNGAFPIADAGATQNLDCTTTSAMIGTSALAGNTYSWSPSLGLSADNIAQPMASPSATTVYTITVMGSNGCSAQSSVTVNVNTTLPTASITGNTTVCNNASTTLTASGGGTYLWTTTDITPSIIVTPGNYTVTVTGSNGCTSSSNITVTSKEGSVGNYVWNDLNANGIHDEASTAGINNVTVELYQEVPMGSNTYVLSQTTTTANDVSSNPGYYNFLICETGNYKVKFPTANIGHGLTVQTTTMATDNNSDADLNDGYSPVFTIDISATGTDKDNMTIDAGYKLLAELGNYVWNDINLDGLQDANEVGVAGITITLFNNTGNVMSSTITDAYGKYLFTNLEPGNYQVGFTLPANYVFSTQNAGGNNNVDNDANPTTGLSPMYTLLGGESNMTVDAGIHFQQPTTASIGNFVWLDTDVDGIQDANETGISGVTVTLYDNLGNTVATTITDANGFYLFSEVIPGLYNVGFTPPIGLGFSANNGTISNPSNSDVNPITGMTSSFTVNAGDEITTVDAGLSPLPTNVGSLGDKVWYDVNQNGEQNPGEIGVDGITVTLYAGDGSTVLSSTTTNTFGNYIFNNLPVGDYVVGFSNLPAGFTLTTNTGTDSTTNSDAGLMTGKTNSIHLSQGQHNMTIDAGIYTTVLANDNSIGNYVWNDLDKDGAQDATEQGVPGITVTLYDNSNTAIDKTSTDGTGYYLFPNLPNGTYYVGFGNVPAGFSFSPSNEGTTTDALDSDADQSSGLTATTSLTGNTHDMTLDAGIMSNNANIGKGSLGDLVWYDINANGLQDPNEGGVSGITVTLYASNGTTVLANTVTDALGNYIFTGLDAGTYSIGFTNLPSGFTVTGENTDSEGINGERNSDVNASTQKTSPITISQGEDKMSVDMGLVSPINTASLGDYVWIDLNNDGLQTAGEPGVPGITVSLYNAIGNVVATTTTNANGNYYFVGLTPTTYSVGFSNLPSGYNLTTQDADANGVNGVANSDANPTTGLTNTVTLLAGDNNLNLDAGIASTIVASAGDYVWIDLDGNGVQNNNEPGLGGVLVTLYDNANNPITSTITKPDGSYIFTNLNAGTYYIGFSNIPSGLEFTSQETSTTSNAGSNADPLTGQTSLFIVVPGTHVPHIDAGLRAPNTAGLGNYVWYDVNVNGIQDANEPAIPGVLVTLYNNDGTVVLATAVTDGQGAYSFTNLPAESYVVGFNAPYIYTSAGAQMPVPTLLDATNDAQDNDADPISGRTSVYTLAVGEYNPNIDAGFYYQIPTPVTLSQFDVVVSSCTNVLTWTTSSEQNTKVFNVLRKGSKDNSFHSIAQLQAAGNSSLPKQYSYVDEQVENGFYEYKLEIVDIDNSTSMSNIKGIQLSCGEDGSIVVYPNPMHDKVNVTIMATEESIAYLLFTDAVGRTIYREEMNITLGRNNYVISTQGLANGAYFLQVKMDSTNETFKLTKKD